MRRTLALTAVALTVAIIYTGWSLGMAERVHLRYTAHALPTVISSMFHGLPWDYSAYEGVTRVLVAGHRAERPGEALAEAAALTEFDTSLRLFPYDDKGYADLAWLGISLFGLSVASVFWAYVLLFSASVATYLIALRHDAGALILLNLALAGTYASLFAFPASTELGEITNPRAIGLLSLVAVAHLLYVALRGEPPGLLGAAAVFAQSALVAFVVFCRSPEVWQAALVIMAGIAAIPLALKARRSLAAAVTVMVAMATMLAGLAAYQRTYFHPSYYTTHGQSRLMWHNAGIGFALNPHLSTEFGLSISDGAMFSLVAERAKQDGTFSRIFTDSDKLLLNPVGDFASYENAAREIVFQIVTERPLQAALTFAVYKPLALLNTFRDAILGTGHRADFQVAYLAEQERSRVGAYLSPIRLAALAAIAICALAVIHGGGLYLPFSVIALIFIGSLLPPMASYPVYHVLGMSFAAAASLFYAALLLVLTAAVSKARLVPAADR